MATYSNAYPDWAGLTDEQIDGAFAAYYDAKMHSFISSSGLQSEITSRLASPWSFVVGVVGVDRFPKYRERTGFGTTEAQTSLINSVQDLGTKIDSKANSVLSGGSLLVLAAVGIVALIAFRK